MGMTITLILITFFGIVEIWLVVILFFIAFQKFLPHDNVVVEAVTLGEVNIPKSRQVFFSVRYRTSTGVDHFRVAFFGADRRRIEVSGRYKKLVTFYQPGSQIRMFRVPKWLLLLSDFPECPVVRVETFLVVTTFWVCGCVLFGFLIAF
jgi:hypothetical protein